MRQEKIREEIRFWRRLIEKWEATRREPVPERMREAIAAAERRLDIAVADEGRPTFRGLFH
jgi:hypothetical protein